MTARHLRSSRNPWGFMPKLFLNLREKLTDRIEAFRNGVTPRHWQEKKRKVKGRLSRKFSNVKNT